MNDTLDVLLVESAPHAGDAVACELEAGGHRVHRCHRPEGGAFPCVGLESGDCPLDAGVDVALVVRHRVLPHPTPFESGATCAIRAEVPLVEVGPDVLDPFEPWAHRCTSRDVVQACRTASAEPYRVLEEAVLERLRTLLDASGTDPGSVSCVVTNDKPRLDVRLIGPDLPPALRQALAVRAHDAVRERDRSYSEVILSYLVDDR
jgi:hypothetical protein